MIGGYQIVDLKSTPVVVSTGTKAVVPGIYDAIEGSKKPIMLENLVVSVTSGGTTTLTEHKPCYIQPSVSSGNFIFTAYDIDFTVTDDDEIYWTASEVQSTVLKGVKK